MEDYLKLVEWSAESSTGLVWKPRSREMFKTQASFTHFKTTREGRAAGYLSTDENGYQSWKIEILSKPFTVSVLVYNLMVGEVPSKMVVDHKNGNALDNSLDNLRLATRSQNKMNEKLRKDNLASCKGVRKEGNFWIARIGCSGKNYLGRFKTLDEAKVAYDDAAKTFYGEFARTL